MKHILYILSVLFASAAFVGCKQNEIELYDQSPRLNFEWSQRIIEFVDTDYIKKTAFKTDSFEVRIQGVHLNAPRDFCLKVQPAEGYEAAPELELADKYTYSALDTVCQTYRLRVKRPELKWGNKVDFNGRAPRIVSLHHAPTIRRRRVVPRQCARKLRRSE